MSAIGSVGSSATILSQLVQTAVNKPPAQAATPIATQAAQPAGNDGDHDGDSDGGGFNAIA